MESGLNFFKPTLLALNINLGVENKAVDTFSRVVYMLTAKTVKVV